jgi:hypothetical protein
MRIPSGLRALQPIQTGITECHFYADNDARELRQKLAERFRVAPEQVLVEGLSSQNCHPGAERGMRISKEKLQMPRPPHRASAAADGSE